MKHSTLRFDTDFCDGFSQIRAEFEVPDDWSAEVKSELEQNYRANHERADFTHLDFITIDPEGSVDLDQAIYIETSGAGFTLYYAIADVAEFLVPQGAIDLHTRDQGLTYYSPDQRNGLHPPQISEDIASLLAGTTKPCVLWKIELDSQGKATDWSLALSLIHI